MDRPVIRKVFEVDRSSQFESWRSTVCRDYVLVECEPKGAKEFRGSMVQSYVGPLQISTVGSGPVQYRRSIQAIRRDSRTDLQLTCLLEGEFTVEQNGRVVTLSPGDMALYDAAVPFVLDCPLEYSAVTIRLPASLLATRVPQVIHRTATNLGGKVGIGNIAGMMVRSVASQAPAMGSQDLHRLCLPLLDVLAAALDQEDLCVGGGRGTRRLEQVKRWIDSQVSDPDLSISAIASANALTVRTLNRLFAREGDTVFSWLRKRRLDRAYSLLAEGKVEQVTEAAYLSGFRDLSHFGRVFKTEFGVPPSGLLRPDRSTPSVHEKVSSGRDLSSVI